VEAPFSRGAFRQLGSARTRRAALATYDQQVVSRLPLTCGFQSSPEGLQTLAHDDQRQRGQEPGGTDSRCRFEAEAAAPSRPSANVAMDDLRKSVAVPSCRLLWP
jgi:hypothetical protein